MPNIIDLCRDLRKQQTPAENLLWQHLRNRKFSNHKFLRQHPVCVSSVFGKSLYYIPDFYCHKAKLVIEADGPIHLFRFTNEEILNDMNKVLVVIASKLTLYEK